MHLLMLSGCSKKMGIKWNGAYSDRFTIYNGGKQGGVLPLLPFNLHFD